MLVATRCNVCADPAQSSIFTAELSFTPAGLDVWYMHYHCIIIACITSPPAIFCATPSQGFCASSSHMNPLISCPNPTQCMSDALPGMRRGIMRLGCCLTLTLDFEYVQNFSLIVRVAYCIYMIYIYIFHIKCR